MNAMKDLWVLRRRLVMWGVMDANAMEFIHLNVHP
jgi:hypothetical protein